MTTQYCCNCEECIDDFNKLTALIKCRAKPVTGYMFLSPDLPTVYQFCEQVRLAKTCDDYKPKQS